MQTMKRTCLPTGIRIGNVAVLFAVGYHAALKDDSTVIADQMGLPVVTENIGRITVWALRRLESSSPGLERTHGACIQHASILLPRAAYQLGKQNM